MNLFIAQDRSFTTDKKIAVEVSLKSSSFNEEILKSMKLGMRPYLNDKKRVERQNHNGSIEILRMKKINRVLASVWVVVK